WNEYMWSVKLDTKLSERHQFSARFNQTHQLADNQSTQTPVNATPDALTRTENHDHVLSGMLTSTLTHALVNEAQVSWHRIHVLFPDESTAPGIRFPNFTTGANFCCPQFTFEDRYQGTDNVTWSRGTHSIKTGVSIAYIPFSSGFQQFHFGQYIANTAGVPQSFTFGVGPSGTFRGSDGGVVDSKNNIYGIFLQDTWKIKPNFTLNYGVRYDYEAGAFRGGSLTIPGKPGCFQGNGIIPACSSDGNNVQPRLGFAWSPGFDTGFLGRLFGGPNRSIISASYAEVTQLAFLNVALDSLNFDGTNLLTVTTSNPAVLASFPNAPPQSVLGPFVAQKRAIGFFGRVRPISNNLKNPQIRHVNLSVRRELSPTTALELHYIGVFGFGLFGEQDVNFPKIIPDPANPGFFLPLAEGTLASPDPSCSAGTASCRLDPRFTAIRTNFNSRTSHYNGGVVSLQRRLASHAQFQTSYTFSKLLTSADDFFGLSEPADPRDIRAELSRSYNDVRHLFNYSIVLDSANLVPGGGWARVANNWSLAFTGTVQSGRPYPISTGTAALATSVFPGLGSETQQRPNVLPNGTLSVLNIANADGSLPSTAPGSDFQFLSGNLGRNVGLGSGYNRLDVSLKRGFQLGSSEQRRLELAADFFNILNHTNFTGYNGNNSLNILPLGSAPAGGCAASDLASGGCIDQRTGFIMGRNGQPLQINNLRGGPSSRNFLAPNWGAALAGIGNPVSADIPRQIQLSARIRW
ncbi:MAG TPA: TonB-dependent receptor, partial [Terriglobales bacterium]